MAEGGSSESQVRMPSLPPLEFGDFSMQEPRTEEAESLVGTGTGLETMASTQRRSGLEESSLAHDNGTEPPSKPALTGEAQPTSHVPPPIAIPPSAVTRTNSEAIGASTDLPTPMLKPTSTATANGPVIQFTLLLASSGTRHPYQINEKYLSKRNIQAQGEDDRFDPSTISVYTLKELILKDWREGKLFPLEAIIVTLNLTDKFARLGHEAIFALCNQTDLLRSALG